MSNTKVKCAECEIEFEKRTADYNRTERKGLRHFCSRSCSVITGNKEMPKERRRQCGEKIKVYSGNRKDEYSPFRLYLGKGRAYLKNHHNELTPKCLKEIWEEQRGICPYTGIQMILPKTSAEWNIHSLKKASLDRIDSSKGYSKENVEFVCMAINLAKNSFTRDEMKEFLLEIGGDNGS
jgi:hypothetical protein